MEGALWTVLEEVWSKASPIAAEQISLVWGFEEELEGLRRSLERIKALLGDAEKKQRKSDAVKKWMEELNDVAYEADNVLDELGYETSRRKVEIRDLIWRKVLDFCSPSNPFVFRLKMANKMKGILKTLGELKENALLLGILRSPTEHVSHVPGTSNMETISVMDDSTIVGRENDVSKVVDLLVNPKDKQVVSVVPIVGMPGLGKTALAKLVYDDLRVKQHFDVKSWVCVSDNFDVKKILGAMFEQLTGDRHTSMPENMDAMILKLKEKIEQAKGENYQIKYLLVLDDVWDVKKWEDLKLCLKGISTNGGNGVIVTTRKEDVASTVQALSDQRHQPRRLEDEECWAVIKQLALAPSPMSHDLEPIGKEIAKQCRGVPLLAKVIGGTMSKERSRRTWLEIQKSGVWGSPDSVLKVESVLKLSFDRLSSPSLKKCFAYCAMFPKDYCFVKEELVQLWMAEGFLGSSMATVDIGDKYLNELLSNSLFQDVKKDKFGNILTFKMHDSVHDLSLSVSKFDTLFFQDNSTLASNECSHIRHLNVGCNRELLPESFTAVAPKLYSLFSEIDVFKKLSKSFTRLRVLKLVDADYILELSDSLGELKHLRYLDISGTYIEALPKSTTKLYHLQTLRLLDLPGLTLPDGFENLISLKHLYIDSKELQPVNVGKLTCLQTLPIFFVGSERGRSIKELGSLKELRGELEICHLGDVRDKQEANGANLHRKEKLCKVIFGFDGCDSGSSGYNSEEVMEGGFEGSDSGSGGYNSEGVMEGLQPHSNLQSLTVWDYRGESFPSWMLRPDSNTGLFLLNNLMELNFYNCINCESLPPLGQLHNLRYLKLRNLKKVKRMGNEFYCNEGVDGMNKVIKVFPALKKFSLRGMESLEEWTAMAETKAIMFPCLERLKIFDCPLLKSVPLTGQCYSLEMLSISLCEKLSKIGDGLSTSTCLKELHLIYCPNLSSIPNLEGFSSLQYLSVQNCNKLEVLPITGGCSSLEGLRICSCEKLSKIGDGLSTSTCLKVLDLEDCPNLSSILSSLQNLSVDGCDKLESFPLKAPLSSLKKLIIRDCPNLKPIPSLDGPSSLTELEFKKVGEEWSRLLPNMLQSNVSLCSLTILNLPDRTWIQDDSLGRLNCLRDLAIGGFSEELQEFPWPRSIQYLSASLLVLKLIGWEKLKSLPPQLQFFTALEELRIEGFEGIEAFPEWLGKLSSLKRLTIEFCPKLMYLPSVDVMRSLSKLVRIDIENCPQLETRCERESGPEWSKISHIPRIYINRRSIQFMDGNF